MAFDNSLPLRRPGAVAGRRSVEVDQGLRAFMLGVYNNMVVGLASRASSRSASTWP